MLRKLRHIKAAFSSAALLFTLAGCATTPFNDPEQLLNWANIHGFEPLPLRTSHFRIISFSRPAPRPTRILSVYIEGDGASWPTPFHPPRDPTPRKPFVWLMAMEDAVPAVIYLGRPCQYLDAAELRLCNSIYWTERRFAPEVIDTYDEILDQLKSLYRFDKLRLVGYSGGGVIAVLLAARRDDITSLITIAAPLSLSDWVSVHGATPLTGSLDPSTLDIRHHPAESIHWVGEKDRIVPADVVKNFVERQGGRMEVVPSFDHDCCWIRDWAIMLRRLSALESEK